MEFYDWSVKCRTFLHAYDTARACESILENGKVGEIYNIGCDEKNGI